MKKLWLIGSLSCFALAAFFALALVGYAFTAAFFAFWGIVILLYHALRVKGKPGLRRCLTAVLLLLFAALTAIEIPIIKASRGDTATECPYLIVLGAGVNGTQPSLSLVNRLEAALDYLQRYPDCVAIVSGGQGSGEDITEAEAMLRYLTQAGIDPQRILKEEQATSTWENLCYSRELIIAREGAAVPVAVVSSEYHLYRALCMAEKLGLEATGVAGHTSYPVLRWNYFLREGFAVTYLWVFG